MASPLILVNHHTPKVGEGVDLLAALKYQNQVWRAQGLPGFQLWMPYDGPHNAVTTVQRWESFEEWDRVAPTLSGIPECRSAVFDHIYPHSIKPYYTHFYREIEP